MERALSQFVVLENVTVKQAMRQIDENGEKILFVVDQNKQLVGSVSDGDIRRWILAEGSMEAPVSQVSNKQPFTVHERYDRQELRKTALRERYECIPVLDAGRRILELLFWTDLFGDDVSHLALRPLTTPIVIMAGGKGTRLAPFTSILPKPLIPIGDKSILEIIIGKFLPHGVDSFFVSLNHKSRIIKSYFEDISPPYALQYIEEVKPSGTAGSLRLLRGKIRDRLLVTNCDIIVDADYADFESLHRSEGNVITLVSSLKQYILQYGVCQIQNGVGLVKITEKPQFDFLVNTGMYIVEAEALDLIPEEVVFHMTELIEAVKSKGGRVGVYPISERSWIDVGEWGEYKQALQRMSI